MKNTGTAGQKDYDVDKKGFGHQAPHRGGHARALPHAVAATTAEVTDRKGVLQALRRCKPKLGRVQSLLCDNGYVGQPFAQGAREIPGAHVQVQIAKRCELYTFKVMPKRWTVERSLARLEKNRRLWMNCERMINTS
ncbi:MAG TPA: transposase [Nitrosomonas mobilis]|nr:transposase [Nitrosomonas mobilis]